MKSKKQIALFRINESIRLAEAAGFSAETSSSVPSLSYGHVKDMQVRANTKYKSMSTLKLNRWLGWIQASIAVSQVMVLEQMKDINRG